MLVPGMLVSQNYLYDSIFVFFFNLSKIEQFSDVGCKFNRFFNYKKSFIKILEQMAAFLIDKVISVVCNLDGLSLFF